MTNIQYSAPLGRAWERMKDALFRPFDLGKWFVIGFTAWLAGLADPRSGGSGGGRYSGDKINLRKAIHLPEKAWAWLLENQVWMVIIACIILVIIGVILLTLWLSSRGKFMFLDNVVHNRARVSAPWHEYKSLGHSLFRWRLGFTAISLAFIALVVVLAFTSIYNVVTAGNNIWETIGIGLLFGLVVLLFALTVTFVSHFLENFVVPIMYKMNLSTTEAWRKFWEYLRFQPLSFLAYALFSFVIWTIAIISVIVAGVLTCCIGIILVILPFIGTVVLLPLIYTYRAFSLEFLAQFDPELRLFPETDEVAEGQ